MNRLNPFDERARAANITYAARVSFFWLGRRGSRCATNRCHDDANNASLDLQHLELIALNTKPISISLSPDTKKKQKDGRKRVSFPSQPNVLANHIATTPQLWDLPTRRRFWTLNISAQPPRPVVRDMISSLSPSLCCFPHSFLLLVWTPVSPVVVTRGASD